MCEHGIKTRVGVQAQAGGEGRRGWCGEVCEHGMKTLGWVQPQWGGPWGLVWTLSLEILGGTSGHRCPCPHQSAAGPGAGGTEPSRLESTSPQSPRARNEGMTACF